MISATGYVPSIHPLLAHTPSLIILPLQVSFQNVRAIFLANIHSSAESHTISRIVLIGCKSDLYEKREVTREEGQQLANELQCPFFETSARNGIYVREAIMSGACLGLCTFEKWLAKAACTVSVFACERISRNFQANPSSHCAVQVPLYPAPVCSHNAAVISYYDCCDNFDWMMLPAQLHQLLCISAHARYMAAALMPTFRSRHGNPASFLSAWLTSDAVVTRLIDLIGDMKFCVTNSKHEVVLRVRDHKHHRVRAYCKTSSRHIGTLKPGCCFVFTEVKNGWAKLSPAHYRSPPTLQSVILLRKFSHIPH